MGKWSTYWHRGRARQPDPLRPPPAPVLSLEDIVLTGTTAGLLDRVGLQKLFMSPDGEEPFLLVNTLPMLPVINWGDQGDYDQGFYRAYNTSEDPPYSGQSEWSNTLYVEP